VDGCLFDIKYLERNYTFQIRIPNKIS